MCPDEPAPRPSTPLPGESSLPRRPRAGSRAWCLSPAPPAPARSLPGSARHAWAGGISLGTPQAHVMDRREAGNPGSDPLCPCSGFPWPVVTPGNGGGWMAAGGTLPPVSMALGGGVGRGAGQREQGDAGQALAACAALAKEPGSRSSVHQPASTLPPRGLHAAWTSAAARPAQPCSAGRTLG